MDAIKKILAAEGYQTVQEMDIEDSVTIEVPEMIDLVIEKTGENRVSVAHYYTQNGDLMSDPEIVFRIDGDRWVPVRYTQHPFIEQHNEDGLDLDGFEARWSRNLVAQGFVEAARKAASASIEQVSA